NPNPMLGLNVAKAAGNMGVTAEYLAQLHGISREDMDHFALRSHQRAAAATEQGLFAREIVPVQGHTSEGFVRMIDADETIRPETTYEALASLPPVFDPVAGKVTAGSSSQLSD